MFKHNNSEDAFIRKIYARLLPVQIVMVAIQSINGIVDGIIGSRLLGSDAMAAVTGSGFADRWKRKYGQYK